MLDRTRVREVYLEALALAAEARAAFLDSRCAGDPPLRAEVESLLAAAARWPTFLESPTTGAPAPRPAEAPGSRIGPYKLLEEIGQGGFGSVYMAEQESPVRRRVALKIIKLGMDTRAVIARFEAERQALAMMDHAHIARVFDAGATESGRPYFVMELVAGEPITAYAERAGLSISQKLDLFVQVCQAVQHAHLKGVIHRDIKPGNVLVAEQDGRPHAKVIDFGIAKATEHRLTEKTVFTEFRQFIGTPEYMSPEQAGGAPDVDTRSDVYSLGVLLYELLTGATPFDSRDLRSAAYAEVQRIIREVEPPKPSTRLSRSAPRGTQPGHPSALVMGDLDWIVMKALDKDRSRRYETPGALAADLARHLAGEPVAAAPPSPTYRLRKFARRNRTLVIAGAAVGAALVLGVIGTSVGLVLANAARVREQTERTAAEASARLAEEQARRAAAAEEVAKARADDLERVAAFQADQLKGIDAALMGARLREDLLEEARAAARRSDLAEDEADRRVEHLQQQLADLNLTNVALRGLDRNIFQRASAAADTQFRNQPLVAARLLRTSGDTLGTLGLYDGAIASLRRALEIQQQQAGVLDAGTLDIINSLGYLLTQAGHFEEAEVHVRAALEGRRKVLGEDSPDTLASLVNLGELLQARAEYARSEEVCRDALARIRRLGPGEAGDVLHRVLGDLAITLKQRGNLEEAELLMREAVEECRRASGDEHAHTLSAMSNLAAVLQARGRLDEATELSRKVLETSRRVLGDEHPSLLEQANNLGVMLSQQNRPEEALPYQRDALARLARVQGEAHPSTLIALNNVAVVLVQLGRFGEAAELFAQGVGTTTKGGTGALQVRALLLHHQADALCRAGSLDPAKPAAVEAVEIYRAHPDWPPAEARHADQVLEVILQQRGDHAEVEPLLRASVERDRSARPPDERRLAARLVSLAGNLVKQQKYAEAESPLRECVDIRARAFPEGDAARWRVHEARSLLGQALVRQADDQSSDPVTRLAKIREAEPLLIDAYRAMKDDPGVPAPTQTRDFRREALLRIVALYEAWDRLEPERGHAAKADSWREAASKS